MTGPSSATCAAPAPATPKDRELAELIRRTRAGNPRFAQLWDTGVVGYHAEDRKVVKHPRIGDITVDCDVLADGDTDLKIVIYTAVPGSEDETKLKLTLLEGADRFDYLSS